jgi:hypothetical protein
MLAAAGSQALEEITNALLATRFEVGGALNALVIAVRIGERRYVAKYLDSDLNFLISHQYYAPSRSAENRPFASPWPDSSSCPAPS